jgi:NADPH-dependent 2,4-dienoyl-CoA reductase/sulfur reductase-like enzyme
MERSIVIVGAGPAGMAAAIEAVTSGCRVTVVDEALRPGGQIYRQGHPALDGPEVAERAELARKRRLLDGFERILDRIDYRPATTAYALINPNEVHLARDDRTDVLGADAVVVATGIREMAPPFPGWTKPGVMYVGGAQALLKSQRVLPGRNLVIAGSGPLPIVAAAQILRAGGTIAALAPLHSIMAIARHPVGLWHGRAIALEGLHYLSTLTRARVPRLTGYVPVRALGDRQVEAVVLARVGRDGELVSESEIHFACDALAINYGFAANAELVAMAGAEMHYDPSIGGWLPSVDSFGRTSVPGLLVAGDVAALRGALVAELEGCIVGAAAANPRAVESGTLARQYRDVIRRRRRFVAFQSAMRSMMGSPSALWGLAADTTVVCRCENVTLGDLRFAFAAGHLSPNTIKRATRAGMGWCGGRTCLAAVAALAARHAGTPVATMMTPRPLARPVPLAALAKQARERHGASAR